MAEPQTPPTPVDYDALATQARQTTPGGSPPPDYEALAAQVRAGGPSPPSQLLGDATKPSAIGPVPLGERIESTFPYLGATVGSVAGGGIPGAALGAAGGKALGNLSRIARTGTLPPPSSTSHAVEALTGPPRPTDHPVWAGIKEGMRQALGLGETAVTTGALPEAGAQAVGALATGVLKPPPGPATQLMKVNEDLGLRLTSPELATNRGIGVIAKMGQSVSERSLSGHVIATLAKRRGVEAARQGVATGAEALKRTGEALGDLVTKGPTYDMLPHKVDAARVFGEEVAPKILDLKAGTLPQPLVLQLQAAAATPSGISPDLALRAVRATKAAIQKGSKEAVPVGTLDALEKILATKDDVAFGSATALRTGLMETGSKGDAVLGARGTALTRKFTGDLTEGMSQAYPPWDPLRHLYAKGAQGLEEPAAAKLLTEGPPEALAAAKAQGVQLPAGGEATAIDNLRYISDALNKRKTEPEWWTKLYNAFEIASVAGTLATKGPLAAAKTASVVEVIPGLITWAAYSPTMTKVLTQGLTSKDPSIMLAAISRVYGAYEASQETHQKSASVGAPPPR